jgi:D-3-phosphoglycerate dehydrogenase
MLKLQPFLTLAQQMGALGVQLAEGRTKGISVRLYGPLVGSNSALIVSAAVTGLLQPLLASAVTIVNARDVAKERGIEIVESHSSRARNFANIISVKVHTNTGERWLEGTVFEPNRPRLTFLDGIEIEAELQGTLLVLRNADKPGVIGQVGSILGRHAVNIASFALGRDAAGAVGVVRLDAGPEDAGLAKALPEIRAQEAVREARVARVS